MAFTTNVWTSQGISLLTQVVAGSGYFNITKVQAGQGFPAGADNPASFVGLKSYVIDALITSLNVEVPYQATLRIRVQSQSAPYQFNWNEFGVFANNGTGTAVLIAYGTTGGNTGDTITPGGSSANVNRDCAVLLPFTTNVTVTTSATLNPAPELHAITHRSTGADPLAIAQAATSGVAPATPSDATKVLVGGATATWAKIPNHAPTHIDNGTDPIPVTTTAHDGLCPKLNGDPFSTLRGDGTWNTGLLPGFIIDYAGGTAPTGWLMCNGQLYSTTTYASLFAVIGYAYGGSGASFAVPDCRGRTTIGAGQGPGLTNRGLTAKGGEEVHTLSAAELPSHTHTVNDPGHSHTLADPGHAHGVYDPTHAHSVADPTHSHYVNDPGHAHSIYDPTHAHSTVPSDHFVHISTTLADYQNWYTTRNVDRMVGNYDRDYTRGATGENPDVRYFSDTVGWCTTYGSSTGIGIYGATTRIWLSASGTGIGIYGAYTGIGIYASGTGCYNVANTTGVYLSYTGGNGAHNNMQPFIALSKIIKT